MDSYISPFKVVILFLVLSIIGIATIPKLSIDLNPTHNLPSLVISYIYPKASPESIEHYVTALLENAFSQLSEVKEIRSVSNYDQGRIIIFFDKRTDIGFKKFEVSSLIRQLYPRLPENLSYPLITEQHIETKNQDTPFLIYSLNAPLAPYQIKNIAEDILKLPISQIDGVQEVSIRGAEELQIAIQFDKDKLALYHISTDDIQKAIQENFKTSYLGKYRNHQEQEFFIKTDKHLTTISQIEDLIITHDTSYPVRLTDIAKVFIEEQEAAHHYRINGLNAVTLSIYAQENVNNIVLARQIKKIISQSTKQLPNEFYLTSSYDESEYLEKELNKIYKRTGLSILILVLFIFLINRNLKYLLILFAGVFINLCLTSILLYFLKINIHLYTLAGITISFGLIVDNAIIMLDHLYKKKNTKVFIALLTASLTTIASLMLIFFLPEEEKQNLIEFSQVIAVALSISLLVALFFTPALYKLLLSAPKEGSKESQFLKNRRIKSMLFSQYYKYIHFISRFRKSFLIFLILLFGLPIFLLPVQWNEHPLYNKIIGSDTYQDQIRPYTDKILGGTLRMFIRGVFEKSGYRTYDKTKLHVSAELPYGNTLEQMDYIIRNVEQYLGNFPGINEFITRIYSGQHAHIVITFHEEYEKISPYNLKSKLIAHSLDWGGVKWDIYGVGKGFSNKDGVNIASYRIAMKGYNYVELEKQAEILSKKLLKHKRIQEVNINERLIFTEKTADELVLNLNKEKLSLVNVNQADVISMLLNRAKPLSISFYILLNQNLRAVSLKEKSSDKFSKYELFENVQFINNSSGIKLNNYGQLNTIKATNTIHKENRQYIRVVGFDYYGNKKFGNDYLEEVLQEMEMEMPIGYSAEQLGWKWNFDKAKRQYGLLLVLIVIIFFICAILFENLKQPLLIILTIPISFIGLFLIFSVFDFYFDQGGYAAFVLLGGLVVNAAIFIINDFNNLKKANYNRDVIKAVTGKSVPILLTIFSTCLGLIPFIIEGQDEVFWFSLAIGTIGGLIFSLFAIFICLPVFLFKRY